MIALPGVKAGTAISARAATVTGARAAKADTRLIGARAVRTADTGITAALGVRVMIVGPAATIGLPIETGMIGVLVLRGASVVRSGIGMTVVLGVRVATVIVVPGVRAVMVTGVRVAKADTRLIGVRVVRVGSGMIGVLVLRGAGMIGVLVLRGASAARSGIGMTVVLDARAATVIVVRGVKAATETVVLGVRAAGSVIGVRVVKAAMEIGVRVLRGASVARSGIGMTGVLGVRVATVIVVPGARVVMVPGVRAAASVTGVRVVRVGSGMIGVRVLRGASVARSGIGMTVALDARAATVIGVRAVSAMPGRSRGMTGMGTPLRGPGPGTAGPTGRLRLLRARSCRRSHPTSPPRNSTRKSLRSCVPSPAISPTSWAGTWWPPSARLRTTTPTGRMSTRRWRAGSRHASVSYARPRASSPIVPGISRRR
ncbi:hypothetical protein [Nonomuraea jiangxiensis]|uniref:hypothetical protein n=1 Tax=Nonomuraea jiangxiensis TaxID=633440 RepID=UPI001FE71099|nr:hypothetical protein [Nonomuraea jiangxiensis]